MQTNMPLEESGKYTDIYTSAIHEGPNKMTVVDSVTSNVMLVTALYLLLRRDKAKEGALYERDIQRSQDLRYHLSKQTSRENLSDKFIPHTDLTYSGSATGCRARGDRFPIEHPKSAIFQQKDPVRRPQLVESSWVCFQKRCCYSDCEGGKSARMTSFTRRSVSWEKV